MSDKPLNVVGHEEYRRVTHGEPGFRRAFAEVFRSRSFLFLGTSLSDPYFLNLFDEVLELQGSLDHVHYALLKAGTVDSDFLRDRLQILTIEYEEHSDLPDILSRFAYELGAAQPMVGSWTYSLKMSPSSLNDTPLEDLRIISGNLSVPAAGESLAISAGAVDADNLRPSRSGERQLRIILGLDRKRDLRDDLEKVSEYVWRLKGHAAFVVVARDLSTNSDYRDARIVRDATLELLTCADAAGFTAVSSMLLAAGRNRKFSPHVSLIHMVRSFARHKRSNSGLRQFKINVTDPSVLHLLSSGRLDIQEMLCSEDMRFWVEVWRGRQEVLRYLEFSHDDHDLRSILEKYDIPSQAWEVHVLPSPIQHPKILSSDDIFNAVYEPWTVAGVGLLPGSTLRLFPSSRHGRLWR